jgi:hypothetical protein
MILTALCVLTLANAAFAASFSNLTEAEKLSLTARRSNITDAYLQKVHPLYSPATKDALAAVHNDRITNECASAVDRAQCELKIVHKMNVIIAQNQ